MTLTFVISPEMVDILTPEAKAITLSFFDASKYDQMKERGWILRNPDNRPPYYFTVEGTRNNVCFTRGENPTMLLHAHPHVPDAEYFSLGDYELSARQRLPFLLAFKGIIPVVRCKLVHPRNIGLKELERFKQESRRNITTRRWKVKIVGRIGALQEWRNEEFQILSEAQKAFKVVEVQLYDRIGKRPQE